MYSNPNAKFTVIPMQNVQYKQIFAGFLHSYALLHAPSARFSLNPREWAIMDKVLFEDHIIGCFSQFYIKSTSLNMGNY